jgi:hypothetical protein
MDITVHYLTIPLPFVGMTQRGHVGASLGLDLCCRYHPPISAGWKDERWPRVHMKPQKVVNFASWDDNKTGAV